VLVQFISRRVTIPLSVTVLSSQVQNCNFHLAFTVVYQMYEIYFSTLYVLQMLFKDE